MAESTHRASEARLASTREEVRRVSERAEAARRAREELQITFLWAPDSKDLWLPERIHFAFGRLLTRTLGVMAALMLGVVLAHVAGISGERLSSALDHVTLFLGCCGGGWFGSLLLWLAADALRPGDWG